MKFQSLVWVTGLSAWAWMAAADTPAAPGLKPPAKSLPLLIEDLANENFRTREEASRKIWGFGDSALSALQEVASGKDPEQAYRARELIRKIQLQITPDTDPAVTAMVERYTKAAPEEKVTLFGQMHKKRAWRQLLKLYASETDPDLLTKLQPAIEGVAVIAARESLLANDANTAREFLEMAPADAPGLLALADFHRSQGTLDAELNRAKTLKGAHSAAWQLALYRAAGNLEAARDAADAAGEQEISATLSALLGDPIPWLRRNLTDENGEAQRNSYAELAIKRWQGKPIHQANLDAMGKYSNGVSALFLLGETGLGEQLYVKKNPLAAFLYFDALERIPEALKTIGLDPDKPDYPAWVEQHMEKLIKDDGDAERDFPENSREMILLASFLERRGLHAEAVAAFQQPLAALAKKDAKMFTLFLATLFGSSELNNAAPQLAREVAITWAGDNGERWDQIISGAFGGQDETMAVWDWLADLKPKASRAERLEAMVALCGLGPDPSRLRDQWLALAWQAIAKTPADGQQKLLEKMAFLIGQTGDVENSLRVWDQLPENTRSAFFWRDHIANLSAAGRWEDAAAFFKKQIDRIAKMKLDPQPSLYACVAACLRKAGHVEEAAAQDARVDKLALGNDAVEIANAYAYGYDYKRAAEWWARATRQLGRNSERFSDALQLHSDMLVEQGNWKEAAAVSEVLAQVAVANESSRSDSPVENLALRLRSDLGRALTNLKTDRAGSIAMLQKCHEMSPNDGSLADDFFPALRRVGLIKEHDDWFKISWDRLTAVLTRFPNSDNTCNTAGWLAGRAQRNLDQAEKLVAKALALNPDQSAYLDTMAEIHFAKGQREQALEWSAKAVNFKPGNSQLRRQHERFRTSPLPR